MYMIYDSSNCLQAPVVVMWSQFPNQVLDFDLQPATARFSAVAVGSACQAWPIKRVGKTTRQHALWAVLAPYWTEISLQTATVCVSLEKNEIP